MSEQTAEAAATESEATAEQSDAEQPKPTETVEFWREQAKKQEKRAKDNAAAAKRLAEVETAQSSDTDRVAKAEARAVEAEARALRREVALEHKLSKDDADLLDSLTDEDAMRRFAERLAVASTDKKTSGNHVPNEGATAGQAKPDDRRAFADFLTGNGRT